MTNGQVLRVCRSIADLQEDYTNVNKKKLEDLVRARKGVKALPPTDPNSFFVIGLRRRRLGDAPMAAAAPATRKPFRFEMH